MESEKIFCRHLYLPSSFSDNSKFERTLQYYGYCPCKLGERPLIHPEGIIRVYSSSLSAPYGAAYYNAEQICF